MTAPAPATRRLVPSRPIDLGLTLGPLRRGHRDPTTRITPGEVWRATRTPEGPATARITAMAPGAAGAAGAELVMQAWGPGAAWALEAFPALVGETDDDSSFEPLDPVVADLRRRLPGLRLCRTGAVFEALVPTILEQKVIGGEAWRSYALLIRRLGEPAPGPLPPPPSLLAEPACVEPPMGASTQARTRGAGGLYVPPSPETLARTPSHVFHRLGVERKRADAVRVAATYAHRLEETTAMPMADAHARLRALPGVGAWTAAEVALVALGDADAVSVGDFHLPHHVAFALAGELRADDTRMLELLAPYAGQRARVVRLITAGSPAPPRFGPRLPFQRIAAL